MMNSIEIKMETLNHTPPYIANTFSSHIDYTLSKSLQLNNYLCASITSKAFIKFIFSPLTRMQTILQCESETFLNSHPITSIAEISKSELKSN